MEKTNSRLALRTFTVPLTKKIIDSYFGQFVYKNDD